jgi:hypothetical protein
VEGGGFAGEAVGLFAGGAGAGSEEADGEEGDEKGEEGKLTNHDKLQNKQVDFGSILKRFTRPFSRLFQRGGSGWRFMLVQIV